MIFDTHAHVLSPDRETYPYGTLRGGAAARFPGRRALGDSAYRFYFS
jgi:predicted TIM-barrel fold metal-dependent hydrolase